MLLKATRKPLVILLSTFIIASPALHTHTFQLVLDPAGDHKNAGRCVVDCFERGIALQWAHRLKQDIEKQLPHIKVTITRRPAEVTQNYQAAQLANRMRADMLISLHVYHEPMAPAIMSLYTYSSGYQYSTTSHTSHIRSAQQAHLHAYGQSLGYVNDLANYINGCEVLRGICIARKPSALPLKQLMGITQPSFLLELGINNPTQWNVLIDPLVAWITHIAQPKNQHE